MFKPVLAAHLHQASAFGLAAIVTLAMLTSLNRLAVQPHEDLLAQAAASAPMQVVLIQGHRIARS